MNLGKYIFGLREYNFENVEEDVKKRQFLAFNLLALMFYILVLGCIVAGIVYGLVLFNDWFLAIVTGLFLGFISFFLLILVLFLTMTTNHQDLYKQMTNMSTIFEPYQGQDFTHLSDEEALKIVQEQKMLLRETNHTPSFDHFHLSGVFTTLIKVCLIIILSCVVSNAMELLMFHGSLNKSLYSIKTSPNIQAAANMLSDSVQHQQGSVYVGEKQIMAKWTLDMLEEEGGKPFLLIDSKSILLSMEVLQRSLGSFKVIMDILIALLFLTPFVLVRKSMEYGGGAYLKEVALSDISTSYYAFLITQRESQKIKHKIETEFDYKSLLKIDQ